MTIKELKEAVSNAPDNAKVMIVDGLNIREDITEVKNTESKDFKNGLIELRAIKAGK